MNTVIVSDTSCLIGLHNIGKLDLLSKLYSRVLIPPSVVREFGNTVPFAEILSPIDTDLVQSLRLLVGPGESEAIALAVEHHTAIILDDKRARMVAEGMGLKQIGTVGILMQAKRKKLIPTLNDVLNELETKGFFVSTAIKEEALRIVGE